MSVKSDEKELQAQARKQKIKAILNEGKAEPKADLKAAPQAPTYADEPLNWSQDEELAHQAKSEEARRERIQREAEEEAAQAARAANPYNVKLHPWERLSVNKRWAVQYRPLTRAEHDAMEDAAFLKKQFNADQAHRERIRRAEQEAEIEQEAALKRAEHETMTGKREYDPGRYMSIEEARRRGYLDSGSEGSSGSGSQEVTPPYNHRDNRGNLMGRFGA